MQIQGSTILITGASGGLGGAMARDLAKRGAKLVISARREALLEELAEETGAEIMVADLNDRADVDRLAERSKTVDVLVCNAGIGNDPPFDELTNADIDRSIEVNLRSPMVLCHAFATGRIAAGKPGQIVVVGSLSGLAPTVGTRLYNATKFGVRGFTLSYRQDLDGTGVGCTLVSPGFIRDAGMFAEGGIDLPPGVRTKSPADVAAGIAKAITKNPPEVFVSPSELRFMSTLGGIAPGFSAAVQKKLNVAERRT